MSEYRQELNLRLTIDEIAAKIQRQVDQAALDKAADTLAEFGYVKVVRCRDCVWFTNSSHYGAYCTNFGSPLNDDYDGFCAWGERSTNDNQ